MTNITIDGIVAARDKMPYLRIFVNGRQVAQCSMAEARNVARDIERMCARTEADAMIHKFFAREGFSNNAGAIFMTDFRDFRSKLDNEQVETTETDPDANP